MLAFPQLPDARRAWEVYELPDDLRVLDLDVPAQVVRLRLRPTQVVVRNLAVTHGYAKSQHNVCSTKYWTRCNNDAMVWGARVRVLFQTKEIPVAAFAVTYTYGADTDAARDQHRPVHVDFLRAAFEAGHLRVSGPFTDAGDDGALLIWEAESEADLLERIDHDPFYVNGLIGHREVRQWRIVFDSSRSQAA